MNLIRYNPRGLTPRFPFDRWFDDFFTAPVAEPDGTRTWSPAVDIEESDKEITLKADLPDVDEKDLSIKVEDDVLTLQAERKFEKETKKTVQDDYKISITFSGGQVLNFNYP